MNELLQAIRHALTHRRIPTTPESVLQERIAGILTSISVPFDREVHLSEKDRIDFLVGGHLGIEVKVDGGLSAVTRQVHRYAQHERIESLVLVTTRMLHRGVPSEMNGKRIDVIHLIGGSL